MFVIKKFVYIFFLNIYFFEYLNLADESINKLKNRKKTNCTDKVELITYTKNKTKIKKIIDVDKLMKVFFTLLSLCWVSQFFF
jgi:flagellar biosynthesis regulator FlaF